MRSASVALPAASASGPWRGPYASAPPPEPAAPLTRGGAVVRLLRTLDRPGHLQLLLTVVGFVWYTVWLLITARRTERDPEEETAPTPPRGPSPCRRADRRNSPRPPPPPRFPAPPPLQPFADPPHALGLLFPPRFLALAPPALVGVALLASVLAAAGVALGRAGLGFPAPGYRAPEVAEAHREWLNKARRGLE